VVHHVRCSLGTVGHVSTAALPFQEHLGNSDSCPVWHSKHPSSTFPLDLFDLLPTWDHTSVYDRPDPVWHSPNGFGYCEHDVQEWSLLYIALDI
jgi:hypothetical protein